MEQQNKDDMQNAVNTADSVVHPTEKNNTLVIILSTLLLISILVSMYFAYQTQTLVKELTEIKNNQQPTPVTTTETSETTQEQTATESGVIAGTEDWKTYVNTKYGFGFKYPLTWEFTESKEPNIQTWYDANVFQLISPNVLSFDHGEINGGYYLTFNVSKPNPNYSNFQEFLNYSKDQYKYSFKPRKINNIDGYIFTQNGEEAGYMFSKNNLFFVINILTDKDIQTLDQILSTFKFTN